MHTPSIMDPSPIRQRAGQATLPQRMQFEAKGTRGAQVQLRGPAAARMHTRLGAWHTTRSDEYLLASAWELGGKMIFPSG